MSISRPIYLGKIDVDGFKPITKDRDMKPIVITSRESTQLIFKLIQGDDDFQIPEGASCTLYGLKSDGSKVYQNEDINVSAVGNEVIINLQEGMIDIAGSTKYQMMIEDTLGYKNYLPEFLVTVMSNVLGEDNLSPTYAATNYIKTNSELTNQLDILKQTVEALQIAVKNLSAGSQAPTGDYATTSSVEEINNKINTIKEDLAVIHTDTHALLTNATLSSSGTTSMD